ncbi:hypothetical protein ACOSP7_027572 [Xanthoceras sorbifolium]
MADNWDLTAVVRSCSSTTDTVTTTTTSHPQKFRIKTSGISSSRTTTTSENPLSFLSSLKFEEEEDPFFFPNLVHEPHNGFEELQDSFKQFFNNNNNPSSSTTSLQEQQFQQEHQQRHHQQQPPPSLITMTTTPVAPPSPPPPPPTTSPSLFVFGDPGNENQHQHHLVHHKQKKQLQQQQAARDQGCLHPLRHVQSRSRKRKTPQKKMVCHVTAENLSADLWAWRKYGQKPIKGSPYPRNYYRCSSSKGCAARKQVERSDTDPDVFIVSYTGDHTHPRPTHRNSLAGSSRIKFPRAQNPVADAATPNPHPSSTATPKTVTAEENADAGNTHEGAAGPDEEDGEDDLLIPNLSVAMNEDPFSGLDELHAHNPAFSGGGGGAQWRR